jgi:hypothetical protein
MNQQRFFPVDRYQFADDFGALQTQMRDGNVNYLEHYIFFITGAQIYHN